MERKPTPGVLLTAMTATKTPQVSAGEGDGTAAQSTADSMTGDRLGYDGKRPTAALQPDGAGRSRPGPTQAHLKKEENH